MDRVFQQSYHIPGTLAANANIRFSAPFDMQLVHVSAVGSNANDATLTVGDSSDPDEYLTAFTIGDSNTPVVKDGDDFVDADGATHARYYPHVAAGTVVVLTLDFDGDGGTAAADVTLVLTWTEG